MKKFCAKNQKNDDVYTMYKQRSFYDFAAKISNLGANSYFATGLFTNYIITAFDFHLWIIQLTKNPLKLSQGYKLNYFFSVPLISLIADSAKSQKYFS